MMKLKNTQECASYQNRTVNVSSETLKTSLRSKIRTSLFTLIASATLLSVQPASAYYATLDNGEVLKRDQFQAMFSPQIILSEFDGANFTGRLDMGLAEGISARGVLGFGEIDFQIGGLVKWIPFPDTTSQPAIGFESGLILSRIGDITQYSIRFHPLVSKKLETEVGDLIPYGSLPLG
ncbi:MAG: hypothetical protein RBT63_06850, partial [Bdellovibrionales bacterium]|nr:hypothetical protein [Bdellovibrionales bacterium]